jgi:hypothetical protein
MRKLRPLALTPVLALAFFVLGTAPAHAFGSEVLGCQVSQAGLPPGTWTANSCGIGRTSDDYYWIAYSPQNLSGTYTFAWTLTLPSGNTVTTPCTATTGPCIDSGCTSTSSTCVLKVPNPPRDRTYVASLVLTQSGLSRTIQAQALITGDPPCCV